MSGGPALWEYLYHSKRLYWACYIPLVNVFGNGGLHGQGHVRPIRKFFSFHISSKYILEMAEDMSKDKFNLQAVIFFLIMTNNLGES